MAHIILKTTKQPKQAAPSNGPLSGYAASAGIQPMVIDFSKNRMRLVSTNVLLIAVGAIASFLVTSLLALFILGDQMNHMWRDAQHTAPMPIKVEKEAEPEAAFPAATITPLPSKAFIVGKDFQQSKSASKALAPMLSQLPLYDKPVKSRGSFVEVETVSAITKSSSLVQQADEAIADGNTQKAVQLYIRAVQLMPNDAGLRSNCVALLLQQARSFDEQDDTEKALSAYKKAQALWQGDNDTAQSIKARISYLEGR